MEGKKQFYLVMGTFKMFGNISVIMMYDLCLQSTCSFVCCSSYTPRHGMQRGIARHDSSPPQTRVTQAGADPGVTRPDPAVTPNRVSVFDTRRRSHLCGKPRRVVSHRTPFQSLRAFQLHNQRHSSEDPQTRTRITITIDSQHCNLKKVMHSRVRRERKKFAKPSLIGWSLNGKRSREIYYFCKMGFN